jgi:hypothetical protein
LRKKQRDNFLISFFKEKEKYKNLAEFIVRLIRDDPLTPKESIHTILYRIKDESRLIEKIDQENISSEFDIKPITHKNFHERIGDIIGIRIICLRLSDIVKVEAYLKFLVEEKISWLAFYAHFCEKVYSYFLKIVRGSPVVIPQECFQRAGFCEIKVFPVCCSLFWWRQCHLFNYVLLYLEICRGIDRYLFRFNTLKIGPL